ncbi:MAG: hypothetical protein ACTSU6_04400 [Candidatus Njordarchaeales archaeon]
MYDEDWVKLDEQIRAVAFASNMSKGELNYLILSFGLTIINLEGYDILKEKRIKALFDKIMKSEIKKKDV